MSNLPETIGAALDRSALLHPNAPAVIDGKTLLDYAHLAHGSERLAAAMLLHGVRKGDTIGIWMPTGAAFVTIFCAAARIGAVAVPVNTRYQTEEVRHVLAHAGVTLLFAQPVMWRTDAYRTLCVISPDLVDATGEELMLATLPALRRIVLTGPAPAPAVTTLDDFVAHAVGREAEAAALRPDVVEADRLLICFTSGSTGKPKGVVHSHRVVRHGFCLAEIQGLAPGERSLANWPLHHAGGLFLMLIPSIVVGSALVVIAQWSGPEALQLIADHKVTVMGGIPTHYLDLIDDPAIGTADISSLRYCYMGGANVARDTFDRIVAALGIASLPSTYGLTENTVSATFNLPGDRPEHCAMNIAPIVADCAVRIVDPESGADVAAGEQGEIQFRGATLMEGYHADPAATLAAFTSDGWLHTGDLGRIHVNGYLQPTGRLKEMLKVGGSNVSPNEVEAVLADHPAVRNAAVVGVPDRRLTEVAYAIVERRAGLDVSEAELIAFCRARIADYKVPRYVDVIEELPRLSTGKVDRAALAARARAVISTPARSSGETCP